MVPFRVFMQEFNTLRITFHRINQTLQQVIFIALGIKFAVFFV